MRERHNKHEQSWSKLNVSDVIVGNLSERNVGAKCLCWKIVLCSHMDGPDANKSTAGSWLRSKIMPIGDCNDDNLVISSPGLSIWKKWIHSLSYGGPLCCLSVIKDAKYGNLEEHVAGASAVLFLVYECIPLELQKLRLENLLTSVPSGSCLPLLILSDSTEDYLDPSSIADQLGLHRIDGSQISSFSVVFLHKNRDGFFSDEVLREGLQWLASNSSPQPILHWAKTHELVLTHLTPSFKVLDKFNAYNASPTHCILAFNEALDRSIEEIANAASTNLSCWPCPEIDLLEYTDERRAVECYLPSLGWSSAARIEPLTRALHHCKLPAFPKMDDDNENRISRLEDSLTRYLTQTSRIMGPSLAKQEACLMLQKWARLELHESTYYIVPQWAMIFRRIFNWQLMSLSKGELSTAYVLEQNNTALTTSRGMDSPTTSRGMDYLIQPSLDEMLQVADNEAFHQPVPMVVLRQDKVLKANDDECEVPENEMSFGQNGNLNDSNNDCVMNGFNGAGSEVVVVDEATKEADRLNELLEKCNMVQNMIDKKLSIYF